MAKKKSSLDLPLLDGPFDQPNFLALLPAHMRNTPFEVCQIPLQDGSYFLARAYQNQDKPFIHYQFAYQKTFYNDVFSKNNKTDDLYFINRHISQSTKLITSLSSSHNSFPVKKNATVPRLIGFYMPEANLHDQIPACTLGGFLYNGLGHPNVYSADFLHHVAMMNINYKTQTPNLLIFDTADQKAHQENYSFGANAVRFNEQGIPQSISFHHPFLFDLQAAEFLLTFTQMRLYLNEPSLYFHGPLGRPMAHQFTKICPDYSQAIPSYMSQFTPLLNKTFTLLAVQSSQQQAQLKSNTLYFDTVQALFSQQMNDFFHGHQKPTITSFDQLIDLYKQIKTFKPKHQSTRKMQL